MENIKQYQNRKNVFPLECIECGAPTKYPLIICEACAKKAREQKKAYDEYVKEQREKYEK